MQEGKSGVIIVTAIICLILGALLGATLLAKKTPKGYNDTEVQAKIDQATAKLNEEKSTLNTQISDLQKQLAEKNNTDNTNEEEEETNEPSITGAYLLEGIFLEDPINKVLSDRETNLFDGKVEFEDKSYNAQETLELKGLKLKANTDDFEGEAYLTIPTKSIEYTFLFSDNLNLSKINDEEKLSFKFLGEKVEISEWNDNEITFMSGMETRVNEGESTLVLIDGVAKPVKLTFVGEDVVWVEVNGEEESIKEGNSKEVSGVDIKVDEVFEGNEKRTGFAILILGKEVEKTISDGEEYEDDGIWNWVITENSLGLELSQEFLELDEEYNALNLSEKVCLPNNYSCVEFDKIVKTNYEDYSLYLDNRNDKEYVVVKGDIRSGIEDYEKVYVNSSGFYDKSLDLINTSAVELANTELLLTLQADKLVVNDFEVNLKLNATNVGQKDYDYRTNYGILVNDPDNSIDEQEFEIFVPEDRFEAIISVN